MTKIDIKKKQKELETLNKLYGGYGFDVKEEEPLDFILEKDGHRFGVEITSYFYNEGFARLKRIPNYRMNVQNDKNIHKDDIQNLKVTSIYIKNQSEEKYNFLFNSVTYKKPSGEEFVDKIIQIIEQKNTRIDEYKKKNVEWFELLIYDEEQYFSDDYQITKDQYDKLFQAAKDSIFRTVYILSEYNGKISELNFGVIPDFLNKD